MPSGAGAGSELPSRAGTPAPDSNAMDVDSEENSVSETPAEDGNKKGKNAAKHAKLKGKEREPVVDVSEVRLLPIRPPRMEELGRSGYYMGTSTTSFQADPCRYRGDRRYQ